MAATKYDANAAEVISVSGTAAASTATLASGEEYVLAVTVDVWFRTDGSDAAVATAGSHFLAKGATDVMGSGATISLIKDTGASDGKASLGPGSL